MPPNAHCPLCGIILQSDPYGRTVDPNAPLTETRPCEVTACQAAITGIGIITARSRLHAPLDPTQSYLNSLLYGLQEWRICEATTNWGFALHDSCWRLFLLRLHHSQQGLQDERTAASLLFSQLYCTPFLESSVFYFGHDYGGAAVTHRLTGPVPSEQLDSDFYADPVLIPSASELEADCPQIVWPLSSSSGAAVEQRPHLNILDRLSPELHFEIFSYLPFEQILRLRLVCRQLASIANPTTLPQAYWRSRFLQGQEAGFLSFTMSNVNSRNWIWSLLEPIAAIVELEYFNLQNNPHGVRLSAAPNDGSVTFETFDTGRPVANRSLKLISSLSALTTSTDTAIPLVEGARVLHYRSQPLNVLRLDDKHSAAKIGISTVRVGTRSFVSGLNMFPTSQGMTCDGNVLGYRVPFNEQWIDIPRSDNLTAINVAFCAEGLRGVQLVFGQVLSDWTGENTGSDIAQGTLSLPRETLGVRSLILGLDRAKVVFIGLGEHVNDREPPTVLSHLRTPEQPAPCLWKPQAPQYEGSTTSPLLPTQPSHGFEPLLNIDFGGQRASKLESFTSLTVYFVAPPYPIVGIEIRHNNGQSLAFGTSASCGLTFFISGISGERITGLKLLEHERRSYPTPGVSGLQFSTNYERTITFAPLAHLEKADISPIPSSPGRTITGLVASEKFYKQRTRISRVGIQTQKLEDAPPSLAKESLNDGRHKNPAHQLQYDKDFFSYFIGPTQRDNLRTYTSIENVRKINASIGMLGRSRGPHLTSGLKIEYYDHPSPGAAGQWIHPFDDCASLELSPGEEIELLNIYLTPASNVFELRNWDMGTVSAIHIRTNRCRSATFSPWNANTFDSALPPQDVRQLQHQYQCDHRTGEKLTALSWIMNKDRDALRAVITSEHGNQKQAVVAANLTLVPQIEPPLDEVVKIYFKHYASEQTIATATAYFCGESIIGLAFAYTDGTCAGVGYFEAHPSALSSSRRQTIQFPAHQRIVQLTAIRTRDERLVEIYFEVECCGGEGSTWTDVLRLVAPSVPLPAVSDTPSSVRTRSAWSTEAAPDPVAPDAQQRWSHEEFYEPPSQGSRLVGMYVGCRDFSHVGGVYETASG
ncbi:F-box protein [Aspergillus stella-maris]|uniref:F-box protein n=1 Tax=Aspergillus stella-maris TaxID=1810926 RepID=UPI003CCE4DA3